MGGRKLTGQEITDLWEAWTPAEVAGQLSAVTAPWCVAAGWALELFNTEAARPHDDIEIAVPRAHFADIAAAVPGYAWDVAGDGRIWPFPERFNDHHQTWLRDPAAGRYRLDVFREPHIGESWVCRRDPAITLPYSELIRRTHDGIPYATPEVGAAVQGQAAPGEG